jgi:flagellar basal-body rod protein FlgF
MDRFLYISMTGAKETLRAQTVNNHNLANARLTRAPAICASSRADC